MPFPSTRRATQKSNQTSISVDLNPWVEAGKEIFGSSQKKRQQTIYEGLEKLVELERSGIVNPADMPREVYESLFTYHPSPLRSFIRGEKPVLTLPPKGAIETGKEPFSRWQDAYNVAKGVVTGEPPQVRGGVKYEVPEGGKWSVPGWSFFRIPSPESTEAARKELLTAGRTPEEADEIIKQQITGRLPSTEERRQTIYDRAEKAVDQWKTENPQGEMESDDKYERRAIKALPAGVRGLYEDIHLTKQAQRQSLADVAETRRAAEETRRYTAEQNAEYKEEKAKREKEESERRTQNAKRLEQKDKWFQSFSEKKEATRATNAAAAAKAKTSKQAYRDALTAYKIYSDNFNKERTEHDKMELGFQKSDPQNYTAQRFTDRMLTWDEWIRTEGAPFLQKMDELEGGEGGGGGGGGGGTPRSENDPVSDFRKKFGLGGK
jgi:hypothetical protein